jgi:hypothetical protein
LRRWTSLGNAQAPSPWFRPIAERGLSRHVVDPSIARSIIMRNSTAYFAGVATVFSATALGFAGAMMLTTATTSQSPTEHSKLEQSTASPAQASPLADPKPIATTNSSGTTEIADQSPAAPAAASEPRQRPQPAAATSPSPQAQPESPTHQQPAMSGQPKSPGVGEPDASSQVTSASNAYARGSDEDIRKYVHKRERHWARRHYRDDNATTGGQDAKSVGQNDWSPSSASENQAASQAQAQPAQIKTADQTSAKIDGSDPSKVKRKHGRHWSRTYSRGSGERGRDEARTPWFAVREAPSEDAPQTFFGTPRWRPLFSDTDDDD